MLIIAINLIITILLYSEKYFNQEKTINSKALKEHLYLAIQEVKDNDLVRYPIIALVILQIYLQFHFHYWQAIFLENKINEDFFYFIYVFFQLVSVFISKVDIEKFKAKNLKILFIVTVFTIILSLKVDFKIIDLFIYVIVLIYFIMLSYLSSYILNKHVSHDRISSIISFNSSLQRIVSSISLLIFAFLLKIINLRTVFILISIILIFVEYIICKKLLVIRKNHYN